MLNSVVKLFSWAEVLNLKKQYDIKESLNLAAVSVISSLRFGGRVFQVLGSFDEKLRSQNLVRTRGWMYRCVLPERRPVQLLLTAIGSTVSIRYDGYWPVCIMCIKIHTLCLMRNSTGSQCRSLNSCVMWSCGGQPCCTVLDMLKN